MKKKEMKTFLNIPIKYILASLVAAVVIFWFIYYVFSKTSAIPAGIRLTRSDWLSFIGDYLSFSGTAVVSFIALWQTYHYNKLDEKRREEERMRSVQPVFSIDLFKYTFTVLDEKDGNTEVTANAMTITHVGEYPVSHVFVFNEYMSNLMTNSTSFSLAYGFEEVTSIINKKSVITLTEDIFDRHEKHPDMPKYFNINYDDIDGRCVYQTYKLMEHDEKIYYSLEKTFEP